MPWSNPLANYLHHQKSRAARQGIGHELTLPHIYLLLYQARITGKDIGKSSTSYCLARFNDTGPYRLGNCRYITVAENNREKKMTPEGRRKIAMTAKNVDYSYRKDPAYRQAMSVSVKKAGVSDEDRLRRSKRMSEYNKKHNATRPRRNGKVAKEE